MEILFRNKALNDVLEEIITAFYELCPEAAAEFERIVSEESKSLVKESAMSADGNFLNLCKLPKIMYMFIRAQMRKRCGIDDFFRDWENYYLLTKVWKNARIRRRSLPRLVISE